MRAMTAAHERKVKLLARKRVVRAAAIAATLLSLGLHVANANAAPVFSLQTDARYIHHSLNTTIYPSSAFAPFNESWGAFEAGSQQFSTVGSMSLQASGYAYEGIDAPNYGATASSYFNIAFDINELTEVTLTGLLQTEAFGGSSSNLILTLMGAGTIFEFQSNGEPSDYNLTVAWDGQLVAGSYVLSALASPGYPGVSEGYDGASFSFDLTVVPEPGTGLLLALGLLGLPRRRS